MSIRETYEEAIMNSEKRTIIANNISEKPMLTSGIITPDSSVEVNMIGHNFSLDKEGMLKIIDSFEKRWGNEPNKDNLMFVLYHVYTVINEFFGGQGDEKNRKQAYWNADLEGLTLSQMEGKRIAQCVERAALGHQLLTLLNKAGVTKYESKLVNSRMASGEGQKMGAHSFIVMTNPTDKSKFLFFDIENPRAYYQNKERNLGIGLYALTEGEYKAFLDGKIVSPKTIYEANGMKVDGDKYRYGSGDEIYKKQESVEFE